MAKFEVIEGLTEKLPGGASSEEHRSSPIDMAVEPSEKAFRDACAEIDDRAFGPEPLEPGHGDRVARDFYLSLTRELVAVAEKADLRIPEEFHTLLWLAARLSDNQKFIARDQSVSPEVVSRWVCAGQTPGASKRRGILASALLSLKNSLERRSVVPTTAFTGRRAYSGEA